MQIEWITQDEIASASVAPYLTLLVERVGPTRYYVEAMESGELVGACSMEDAKRKCVDHARQLLASATVVLEQADAAQPALATA